MVNSRLIQQLPRAVILRLILVEEDGRRGGFLGYSSRIFREVDRV